MVTIATTANKKKINFLRKQADQQVRGVIVQENQEYILFEPLNSPHFISFLHFMTKVTNNVIKKFSIHLMNLFSSEFLHGPRVRRV